MKIVTPADNGPQAHRPGHGLDMHDSRRRHDALVRRVSYAREAGLAEAGLNLNSKGAVANAANALVQSYQLTKVSRQQIEEEQRADATRLKGWEVAKPQPGTIHEDEIPRIKYRMAVRAKALAEIATLDLAVMIGSTGKNQKALPPTPKATPWRAGTGYGSGGATRGKPIGLREYNHCHEPAGGPSGGQFTSGDDCGGGGAKEPPRGGGGGGDPRHMVNPKSGKTRGEEVADFLKYSPSERARLAAKGIDINPKSGKTRDEETADFQHYTRKPPMDAAQDWSDYGYGGKGFGQRQDGPPRSERDYPPPPGGWDQYQKLHPPMGSTVRDRVKKIDPQKRLQYAEDRANRVMDFHDKEQANIGPKNAARQRQVGPSPPTGTIFRDEGSEYGAKSTPVNVPERDSDGGIFTGSFLHGVPVYALQTYTTPYYYIPKQYAKDMASAKKLGRVNHYRTLSALKRRASSHVKPNPSFEPR